MEEANPTGRSIAVIGSGVAGLTAAHVLSARDRVTLFEADSRIGGHAHAHYLDRGDGIVVGIDTAVRRFQRAATRLLRNTSADCDDVVVTNDVTRLVRLRGPHRFLVTLGGHDRIDPQTVLTEMRYAHPQYTPESVAAQRRLPELDDDKVVFAGACHGWGFHEDGAASGLRAAKRLGTSRPSRNRRTEAVSC